MSGGKSARLLPAHQQCVASACSYRCEVLQSTHEARPMTIQRWYTYTSWNCKMWEKMIISEESYLINPCLFAKRPTRRLCEEVSSRRIQAGMLEMNDESDSELSEASSENHNLVLHR